MNDSATESLSLAILKQSIHSSKDTIPQSMYFDDLAALSTESIELIVGSR